MTSAVATDQVPIEITPLGANCTFMDGKLDGGVWVLTYKYGQRTVQIDVQDVKRDREGGWFWTPIPGSDGIYLWRG